MRPSVLVTGASSGIGAATAARLAARGFEVFGTSRTPERQSLPGVRFIALDVRDEQSVAKGVAQVLASVPRLDALVCNAGIGIFGSVEEVPIEAAREQFETNFFGTLRVLRAVLPHLREARHGRIVILGSLAGRRADPVPGPLLRQQGGARRARARAAQRAARLRRHGLADRARRHPHRIQRAHGLGRARRARAYGERLAARRAGDPRIAPARSGAGDRRGDDRARADAAATARALHRRPRLAARAVRAAPASRPLVAAAVRSHFRV